jgi:serine/threonine protein kinase
MENLQDYKDTLDRLDEPAVPIGCQCHEPYDCPYFEYCTQNLPKPNVFDLSGAGVTFSKKVDMYSKGIITYEDILSRKPKINEKRMNEVRCEVEKKNLPVNMDELKTFMDSFVYPINFLDFETYQNPIPEYKWSQPYKQIPFQYSLHVLYEDGRLEHKEFIAPVGTDERASVRDRLIADLSENDGSIVAYNAAFEKMVIRDLAEVTPWKYYTLMKLRERFIDLMVPFINQWIYKHDFKGSYSIKYVLPGLFPDDEELNYKNLDTIQNGSIAMKVYQNMKKYSKEEQDKMFERLYKYCGLDTYAMVKIYWFLQDLVKGKVTLD